MNNKKHQIKDAAKTNNMIHYLTSADAIADLHNKGFINDFQIYGNELLWVQEGVFLRPGEFAILEHHKIIKDKNSRDEDVVFGIIATYHNVKGILLNHYKSYTSSTPPVLSLKLNELNFIKGLNGD